jgi:hypothetical protein
MDLRWIFDGSSMDVRWFFDGCSMVLRWMFDGFRGFFTLFFQSLLLAHPPRHPPFLPSAPEPAIQSASQPVTNLPDEPEDLKFGEPRVGA